MIDVATPNSSICDDLPAQTVANATPATIEAARILILKGSSARETATKLGLSYDQVRQWQTRNKWRAQAVAVHSTVSEAVKAHVVTDLVKERVKASIRARRTMSQVLEQQAKVLAESKPTSISELGNTKEGQGAASIAKTVIEGLAIIHNWREDKGIAGMDLRDADGQIDDLPAIDIESTTTVQGL